jgi:hypothetical protein
MLRDAYIKMVNGINKRRLNLTISKGHDYADDTDHLLNFKQVQQLCKLLDIDPRRSPGDVARFNVVHKMQRWSNLMAGGKKPKHESIMDTIEDLHNYVDLAVGCDVDDGRIDYRDDEN